ncbi:MAG: hypothetical protein LBI99_09965 [Propionibacteriaceae bacterium]|nr:hypothetical protein [Propionibacteriaceae bacterium]
MGYQGYVAVQSRGVIALPADLRRRYYLDAPGAQIEITERSDGVFEMRPAIPVPTTQAWFWDERWQQREQEVDAHVAAKETARVASNEEMIAVIDELLSD